MSTPSAASAARVSTEAKPKLDSIRNVAEDGALLPAAQSLSTCSGR